MFHVANGLYFKRLENGNVLIEKRESAEPRAKKIFMCEIEKDAWISVMTAVSGAPDCDATHRAAAVVHDYGTKEG